MKKTVSIEKRKTFRHCDLRNGLVTTGLEMAFRRSTRQRPYQFVLHCRIERTNVLLRSGELTVRGVGLRMRFVQQNHFGDSSR